jgi:hypothetical protein
MGTPLRCRLIRLKHMNMSTPPPLSDVLGPPHWFGLDEEFWTAVGVIAWLRMWANDPIRAATRTRGDDKNWLNDAQGAFGELLAIRRSGSHDPADGVESAHS